MHQMNQYQLPDFWIYGSNSNKKSWMDIRYGDGTIRGVMKSVSKSGVPNFEVPENFTAANNYLMIRWVLFT